MKRRNFISGAVGAVAGWLGMKSATAGDQYAATATRTVGDWDDERRDAPTTDEKIAVCEDLIQRIKFGERFGIVGQVQASGMGNNLPFVSIELDDFCSTALRATVLTALEIELAQLKRLPIVRGYPGVH